MKIPLTILFSLFGFLTVQAKSDTLITMNHDKLIGEFKALEDDVLTFSTSYSSDDFKIDWDQVRYLSTNHDFRITHQNGTQVFGRFQGIPGDSLNVYIVSEGHAIIFPYLGLISIAQIDYKFWDRVEMKFDLGFSKAKRNNTTTLNFDAYLAYNAKRWKHYFSYNSYASLVDTIVTGRGTSELGTQLELPHNWVAFATLSRFYSDELNLDARRNIILGSGKYLLRKRKTQILVFAGASYNSEIYQDTSSTFESYEGFLAGTFHYKKPDLFEFNFQVTSFPSFTESGRVRTNLSTNLKWDLTKRFTLGTSFTYNLDTKPPVEANKEDYVFNLTFGWEL